MKKFIFPSFLCLLLLSIVGFHFLWGGGTYFLLDSIWFPVEWIQFFEVVSSRFFQISAYRFVHDFFSALLGYQLFSKVFFIGILLLSGILGGLLAKLGFSFLQGGKSNQKSDFLVVIGSLVMMFNPVLYERMFTQPGVYFAMVMLGYGLYFLLKTLQEQRWQTFLYAGLSFAISAMLSAHFLFMIALIFLLYAVFFLRKWKQFWGLVCAGSVILLGNANWLIGGFFGQGSVIVDTVATLNQANVESFLTNALAPLNVEFTTLFLYGFWGERAGHFYLPTSFGLAWIWGALGIFVIAIFGYTLFWKKNKKLVLFYASLFLCGWIFSTGISSEWFGWINQAMFDHIPMYLGLRELQKWIVLPILVVAIGVVAGVGGIAAWLDELFDKGKPLYQQIGLFAFVFLLLFLWTPHLLFGFHGQLKLSDYPQDFAEYRASLLPYLKKFPSAKKVLILPWHSYLACEWTLGRVVSNPLKGYLGNDERLITADNIEVASLYTNSVSPQSQAIEAFLENKDLGLLKDFGIQKIVMMEKCADFQNYDFLSTLSGLNKSFSSATLSAYDIAD